MAICIADGAQEIHYTLTLYLFSQDETLIKNALAELKVQGEPVNIGVDTQEYCMDNDSIQCQAKNFADYFAKRLLDYDRSIYVFTHFKYCYELECPLEVFEAYKNHFYPIKRICAIFFRSIADDHDVIGQSFWYTRRGEFTQKISPGNYTVSTPEGTAAMQFDVDLFNIADMDVETRASFLDKSPGATQVMNLHFKYAEIRNFRDGTTKKICKKHGDASDKNFVYTLERDVKHSQDEHKITVETYSSDDLPAGIDPEEIRGRFANLETVARSKIIACIRTIHDCAYIKNLFAA